MLRRALFALALATLASITACSTGNPQAEEDAQRAANMWLNLVDAGQYERSWTTSAAYFRKAVPEDWWNQSLGNLREPLGELVERKLASANYTTSIPGAPEGEYVVIEFKSAFANKQAAVETVTPMKDPDGKWRVSRYYIR